MRSEGFYWVLTDGKWSVWEWCAELWWCTGSEVEIREEPARAIRIRAPEEGSDTNG